MTSEELKEARLMLGRTQADMGLLMGMSGTNYARLERGDRRPTKKDENCVALIKYINLRAPGGVDSLLSLWLIGEDD